MIFAKDAPNIGNENNQAYYDDDEYGEEKDKNNGEEGAEGEGGRGGGGGGYDPQPYMNVTNADECLQEVARVIYQDDDTRSSKLHEYLTSYIACLEELIIAEEYEQLSSNQYGFELVSAIQE